MSFRDNLFAQSHMVNEDDPTRVGYPPLVALKIGTFLEIGKIPFMNAWAMSAFEIVDRIPENHPLTGPLIAFCSLEKATRPASRGFS